MHSFTGYRFAYYLYINHYSLRDFRELSDSLRNKDCKGREQQRLDTHQRFSWSTLQIWRECDEVRDLLFFFFFRFKAFVQFAMKAILWLHHMSLWVAYNNIFVKIWVSLNDNDNPKNTQKSKTTISCTLWGKQRVLHIFTKYSLITKNS